jgi:hypothetical protein
MFAMAYKYFSGVFVSVSDVYCKSFRHMLQVFHLNVAK